MGEFVQSSPLQMPQADVHSSPFSLHVHLMVLHPDLQSINLDGAGVDQLSLATVAHHFLSSPITLALDFYLEKDS